MRGMARKDLKRKMVIESTSYLWCEILTENKISKDGVIIEVAPGYESKIGNALNLYGFRGTIFLIEPDRKAANYIQRTYEKILTEAIVKTIVKPLEDVEAGVDVPAAPDAFLASHPFDDMVIALLSKQEGFFSIEKEERTFLSSSVQNFYGSLSEKDYIRATLITILAWKDLIERLRPGFFIASQYPSHTLMLKGLVKRQESGFAVLQKLKNLYKNSSLEKDHRDQFGFKGDLKWWIVAKKPRILPKPLAFRRLGKSVFVPQKARRLSPEEYDIIYADRNYFKKLETGKTSDEIRDFAIILDDKKVSTQEVVMTYADRQKDKTGIALCGNLGSARAVYYGDKFNILGVGKTTLCQSSIPSHSTGKLELVGAMRRIILSRWINYFTNRAPIHPALIALRETARYKWNPDPIPLCLLVRVDDGCFDRPSHVEQSPDILVDFQKTLIEYAKLDAEYFAYRLILGAWSNSNYSLYGHVIDLESASFVKYRGPYYTSTSRYPHNRFGHEGLGFLKILRQLAGVKGISDQNIVECFYRERRKHLGYCLLLLLGIEEERASEFFLKYSDLVIGLSDQFETLSKKISPRKPDLNLYMFIPDDGDPTLLDMSNLFRNFAELFLSSNREETALEFLLRKSAFWQNLSGSRYLPSNPAEKFIVEMAVVSPDRLDKFLFETKNFVRDLFLLLDLMGREGCLEKREYWHNRLEMINQDFPTMFELNQSLKFLAESYRLGRISPKTLGIEIEKLCEFPRIKKSPGQ